MAAAEARAAWQRLANRYIVQEDAKRAPKLACCPSSSSMLQFDLGNGEGDNGSDSSASNFMPVNRNAMYPNLSPETKWWLQLQPNFGHQNDFVHEQISKVEDDCGDKTMEIVSPNSELPTDADTDKNACAFQDSPCVVSATIMKNDGRETKADELKVMNSNLEWPPKHKADFCEHWYMEDELMDWKIVDQLISTASGKDSCDLKSNWSEGKTEPWWRVTDKEELALLVAKKSLEHFENCDLPPPKRVHFSVDPLSSLGKFDTNEKLHSSFDKMLQAGIYHRADHAKHSSTYQVLDREPMSYDKTTYSLDDSRPNRAHSHDAYLRISQHKSHTSDTDSNKVQLLEALCHSQTRAREAEIAAQKANNEKENVIKLLFKQASHLFAYKQWLRLLQLESLYLQLKMKEQQLSTLLPSMPWVPDNDEYKKYSRKEGKKKKKKKWKCSFCRYIVAFAIGMSLASAGLLLGWTLGWLFPLI